MHTNAHMTTAAFHASRGSGPRGHAGNLGARGPARVHKNYWQLASKRGAAKELRFFGFLPADVAIVHVGITGRRVPCV